MQLKLGASVEREKIEYLCVHDFIHLLLERKQLNSNSKKTLCCDMPAADVSNSNTIVGV